MNKRYLVYGISGFVILALLISGYFIFIPQQFLSGTACYGESDAGYDIYNKGTVTFTTGGGSQLQYSDECVSESHLREYNCVDHPTYVSYHDVDCACSDGACQDELCTGVSCFNKCDAGNLLYDGECNPSTGTCEYRRKICDYGCENAKCNEPACITDSDCAASEQCLNNQCKEIPSCLINADCQNNEKCLDNKCVTDFSCETNDDCEEDELCKLGECVERDYCLNDGDCSNSEICIDGRCTEISCTEGEVTEYLECSNGDRIPACLCIDGIEQCKTGIKCKSYTAYIVIGIIVIIIILILLYSLYPKLK